jgi:hypothetical protein
MVMNLLARSRLSATDKLSGEGGIKEIKKAIKVIKAPVPTKLPKNAVSTDLDKGTGGNFLAL